jgi:hypothetical protein
MLVDLTTCFTPKTLIIIDLHYCRITTAEYTANQRNWCPQQLGKLLSFLY